MTKSRIPVTLVTGFLGSGKTTLINAALRSPELAKTVVVVNEFGEVGLDHQLFASSSDSVVVLENGCLCCTVRSDLVGTLNSLYHARQAGEIPAFDNVVIETSGSPSRARSFRRSCRSRRWTGSIALRAF